MKTNIIPFFSLVAVFALSSMIGCSKGPSSVPVSGVVTLDGKPISGLRVTFFPQETNDVSAPGPYSTGITDENGKYELKNRYEEDGVIVWQHMVSFEYDDVDEEAMSNAKEAQMDAQASGVQMTAEEKAMAKNARAQMNKHPRIPKRYLDDGDDQFIIDVPKGGSDSINFEMTSGR